MTPTFDLPRSFDPAECLPGRLALKTDYAKWLVSTIVRRTAARDMDRWGCARFGCDELDRVLGKSAEKIIRAMQAAGVIEGAPSRPGAKIRTFRLAHRYAAGNRYVRVPCANRTLRHRLFRERRRMEVVDG
jgi:hypothetical protein